MKSVTFRKSACSRCKYWTAVLRYATLRTKNRIKKYEVDLKYKDDLKNEEDLENKDDLKNEDNLKMETTLTMKTTSKI